LIARFGIFLHWLNDRSSHWYCGDAPDSGLKTVMVDDVSYNVYMYMSPTSCDFVEHGMVHYWEQAVDKPLAPGSYFALKGTYKQTKAFRDKFVSIHPEWFRQGGAESILSMQQIVGTPQNPGVLYKTTVMVNAKDRTQAEIDALKQFDLPPLPGFEQLCREEL
jgi:hypothetical protein